MVDRQALSPHEAQELLERQAHLQAESRALLADLDLMTMLRSAGHPVQIGSSVLGLMVWRDIDIQVYCDPVSADLAFETLRQLERSVLHRDPAGRLLLGHTVPRRRRRGMED